MKKYSSSRTYLTHNGGNNGGIHRSLKYCIQNFESSMKISKHKIKMLYTLKKTSLKAERKTHSTVKSRFTHRVYVQ